MIHAVQSYVAFTSDSDSRVVGRFSPGELADLLERARVLSLSAQDWRLLAQCCMEYEREAPGRDVAWPPELPFPVCWIGSSTPMAIQDLGIAIDPNAPGGGTRALFCGVLASETDLIMVALSGGDDGPIGHTIAIRSPDGWWSEETRPIGRLIYAALSAFDRVHATVKAHRIDAPAARKLRRETRAPPAAPVPREYHVVDVRDRLRWEGIAKRAIVSSGPCMAVGHRHDVRAHWRLLVRRGPLAELDARVQRDLLRRGYEITTGFNDDLSDDLDAAVRARGIRRPDGEYLAALLVRVRDCVRGPADRPYVPSAWRAVVREPLIPE